VIPALGSGRYSPGPNIGLPSWLKGADPNFTINVFWGQPGALATVSQFVSEWVLIEDPQTNNALEVQSGKVLYHSKDRDEVYREAVRLRPKRFAMLYTGTFPRDTEIVL